MLGVVRFPEAVPPVPHAGGVHGAAYEGTAACPQALKGGMVVVGYGAQYDKQLFVNSL